MSTAVLPASRSVSALAALEARRLAKHPAFLIGAVATVGLLAVSDRTMDYYNVAIIPAFFVGLFGMVATFRLTRSMEKLEEAVGTTPAGVQDRVRALCLATAIPGALGVLSFVTVLVHNTSAPDWAIGSWSSTDRAVIFLGEIVVACVGGPLLGIAAARWLRLPGAIAALVVGTLFVVLLGEGFADSKPQAAWATTVRMLSPWTQFTSVNSEQSKLACWPGSPWFHLGWTVALCALAVLGALLKGAEGDQRQRLFRTGLVVGVVGLAFVALAVTTGPEPTLHTPAGVSPLTGPIGG